MPRDACSEPHPEWEWLDHGDCPICRWGASAGRERLLDLRSAQSDRPLPASPSASPAELEARLAAFIADAEGSLRSTEPADRGRVAAAFATYLGGDVPPIEFVSSPRAVADALADVDNDGKATVAFSLFPTSMKDLLTVSDANEIMPPKSTWFEPKLRDGLLIHTI